MSSGNDVANIVIRPATEADARSIGALWEELASYHHSLDSALPIPSENGDEVYAARVRERLDDTHMHVVVAEDNAHSGRLVGFALGMIMDMVPEMFAEETAGFLADIFVDQSYRRQGVGRALADAMASWFRSRGVAHMEWFVAARNEEARDFWRSLGGRDVMVRMRINL